MCEVNQLAVDFDTALTLDPIVRFSVLPCGEICAS